MGFFLDLVSIAFIGYVRLVVFRAIKYNHGYLACSFHLFKANFKAKPRAIPKARYLNSICFSFFSIVFSLGLIYLEAKSKNLSFAGNLAGNGNLFLNSVQ